MLSYLSLWLNYVNLNWYLFLRRRAKWNSRFNTKDYNHYLYQYFHFKRMPNNKIDVEEIKKLNTNKFPSKYFNNNFSWMMILFHIHHTTLITEEHTEIIKWLGFFCCRCANNNKVTFLLCGTLMARTRQSVKLFTIEHASSTFYIFLWGMCIIFSKLFCNNTLI